MGEEDYDPARKADILGSVGRTSQIPDGGFGAKRWNAGKIRIRVGIWFHSLSLTAFVVAMDFSIVGARHFAKNVEFLYCEGVWPCLDPWDVVRLHT